MLARDMRIKRICDLVVDHHLSFMGEVFGPGWIDAADYSRLHKGGMIKETICPGFFDMAYRMGGMPAFKSFTPGVESLGKLHQVMELVKSDRPLTDVEEEAIRIAKSRVAKRIVGLSQRMTKAVRSELARTITEGGSALETAGIIAKMTGDANRDWLRVVVTELHTAVQEGKAAALIKRFGGDPLVYKRPQTDACPFCRSLYLKNDGVTPRVFRYSELIEKGSNENRKPNPGILRGARKSDDWQPVMGSVHPWCRCELYHLPDGFIFNDRGALASGGRMVKAESVPDLIYHECISQ